MNRNERRTSSRDWAGFDRHCRGRWYLAPSIPVLCERTHIWIRSYGIADFGPVKTCLQVHMKKSVALQLGSFQRGLRALNQNIQQISQPIVHVFEF